MTETYITISLDVPCSIEFDEHGNPTAVKADMTHVGKEVQIQLEARARALASDGLLHDDDPFHIDPMDIAKQGRPE